MKKAEKIKEFRNVKIWTVNPEEVGENKYFQMGTLKDFSIQKKSTVLIKNTLAIENGQELLLN